MLPEQTSRTGCPTWNYAVVICRNREGKFVAVNDVADRGWWVPGGRVEPGENFHQAAIRKTKNGAGIDVEIKGIMRIEHTIHENTHARMRVVFYAEPVDDQQPLKQEPDAESLEARWVTVEQSLALGRFKGPELVQWGKYLANGGTIFPLGVFAGEGDPVPEATETGCGCFTCLQAACSQQ